MTASLLAIIKASVLAYEFLSIHPFQDGNGRLSRLLTNLALLKNGYVWIQYISFEHEIENQKQEYYSKLRECQAQRPSENLTAWVLFFLKALRNIQKKLLNKLEAKENLIVNAIKNKKQAQSGEIASELGIPLPTVKRLLNELTKNGFLIRQGKGPGTYYVAK